MAAICCLSVPFTTSVIAAAYYVAATVAAVVDPTILALYQPHFQLLMWLDK